MARLDIVQFLCESGAELDAVDVWGRTALYLAAKHNNLAIVEMLIENGAAYDLQVTDKEEDVPESEDGQPKEPTEAASVREEEEDEEEEVVAAEVVGRTALHIAAAGL